MSGFLRPEVVTQMRRYAEALIGLALLLIGALFFWRGWIRFDLLAEILGLVVVILGAALLYVGYRRAQFMQGAEGTGLVELREQQIVYMTALGGGTMDVAAINRLELRQSQSLGRVWVLKQSGGPSLMIPVDAQGAAALFDAFQALPGLSAEMLVAALRENRHSRQIVWRGDPGFRALT